MSESIAKDRFADQGVQLIVGVASPEENPANRDVLDELNNSNENTENTAS